MSFIVPGSPQQPISDDNNVVPSKYGVEPLQYNNEPAQQTIGPAQYNNEPAQHVVEPAQYSYEPVQIVVEPLPQAVPEQLDAEPLPHAVVPSQPGVVPAPQAVVPSQPGVVPAPQAVDPSQPDVIPVPQAVDPSQPDAVPIPQVDAPTQPDAEPVQQDSQVQAQKKLKIRKAVKTCAAVLAAVLATAVIVILMIALTPENTDPIRQTIAPVGSVIVFGYSDSNSDPGNKNPDSAKVLTMDVGNTEITALEWQITPRNNSEEILYSGEGGVVEFVFAKMKLDKEQGEYMLFFTLVNQHGDTFRMGESFVIN